MTCRCVNFSVAGASFLLFLSALGTAARADVAVYRTGQLDSRVQRVPSEIQQGVFAEPRRYCEPLVHALVDGVTDDFQKVKTLHDWIAENIAYDVESFLSGARVDAAWEDTLLRRKSVCQGYAALLEKMCQVANIPCKVISGYGRGYGFNMIRIEKLGQTNHAWNVVQIQGRWYLVDVTWDAGHVQQGSFQKKYSTACLFPEPRQFLHTHFPSDPRWQLLDPPFTAEQFAQLPYLPGEFFEQGLRLATNVRRLHPVGESVQFTIESPADVVLSAQLTDAAAPEADKFERRTLIRRQQDRSDILVTFPKAGRWNVQVFSKRRNDPGTFWQVATLEFESNAGTPWTFPEVFSSIDRMDVFLENPLYVPLVTGAPQEFKIRVHGAEEVHLRIGTTRWLPMPQAAGTPQVYRLSAQVSPGETVQILAKPPGRNQQHWTVVDFTPQSNSGR